MNTQVLARLRASHRAHPAWMVLPLVVVLVAISALTMIEAGLASSAPANRPAARQAEPATAVVLPSGDVAAPVGAVPAPGTGPRGAAAEEVEHVAAF